MHNGIEFDIPVEGEISFDFYHTITLESRAGSKKLTNITYQDIQAALYKLQEYQSAELEKDSKYGNNPEED